MFRRKPQPTISPEWMIVGLGNPGPEYRGTKHNLGFEVVDQLASRLKIKLDRSKHRAKFGLGEHDGHGVILVKPLTFMNLSGQAVAPLARDYSLKANRILVVSDDTDLTPGRTRLKPQGTAGGHNGHKSLIAALCTTEYPRLKLGIGRVDREGTIDHVLGGFTPEERKVQEQAIARAVQAIEVLLDQGLEAGMNIANAN